jgi:acetylornithine deacetylase/succinyl-diaminopimelate desuccinylase-like protein
MNPEINILQDKAISLLKRLIATPSFSKEEQNTADLIERFLEQEGVRTKTHMNNIWAQNKHFTAGKPVLLLNSHHDTVKPNKGYTLDPFQPVVKEDKLYGLGSNDAGGSLVALLAVFLYYYHKTDLNYNLIFAATAEEEISGHNGIEALIPRLGPIDCGIVGEPTQMQMAVAEKGLLVLDAIATGRAGHAAREEGENALYKAMEDIQWLKNHQFEKVSALLGPVKTAHCKFVIDCRVNELYSFEEIIDTLKKNMHSDLQPRSTRLRSTAIALDHPLVKAGLQLGRTYYGSPTTSDKALMPFQTLKMGPGDSARSHTADEFIFINEIKEGIELYIQLLDQII